MLHKYPWETDTKVLMLFFFFLHSLFRTTVFLQLIKVSPTEWSYKPISIYFPCLNKNQFTKE